MIYFFGKIGRTGPVASVHNLLFKPPGSANFLLGAVLVPDAVAHLTWNTLAPILGSLFISRPLAIWLPQVPDRRVISILGDGGFGQYPMEFTTAVKYGMDITHILLHNAELGKISKEQRSGEWVV